MCGRIVIVWDARLRKWVTKHDARPARLERMERSDHYNIGPRWPVPVLVRVEDARAGWLGPRAALDAQDPEAAAPGTAVLTTARWGFPLPGHRKDVFNTQIERAAASPMWRGSFGKLHGVVPVTGFYEWDHRGAGEKQPYYVRRRDGQPMALAAVLGQRQVADPQHNETMLCASIVTCPPSGVVATLHDRMPALLEDDEVLRWLDPQATGRDMTDALLRPRGEILEAVAVSTAVNRTASDGSGLVQPVGLPPRQGKLF